MIVGPEENPYVSGTLNVQEPLLKIQREGSSTVTSFTVYIQLPQQVSLFYKI